jgi:hypothetical protein
MLTVEACTEARTIAAAISCLVTILPMLAQLCSRCRPLLWSAKRLANAQQSSSCQAGADPKQCAAEPRLQCNCWV